MSWYWTQSDEEPGQSWWYFSRQFSSLRSFSVLQERTDVLSLRNRQQIASSYVATTDQFMTILKSLYRVDNFFQVQWRIFLTFPFALQPSFFRLSNSSLFSNEFIFDTQSCWIFVQHPRQKISLQFRKIYFSSSSWQTTMLMYLNIVVFSKLFKLTSNLDPTTKRRFIETLLLPYCSNTLSWNTMVKFFKNFSFSFTVNDFLRFLIGFAEVSFPEKSVSTFKWK